MINKENYPEYMLSFMDGKLSPVETDALLQFIEDHPEIKIEMEGLEQMKLEPEEERFDKKDLLIRGIFKADETLYVAALENDLGEEKRNAFLDWIEEDSERKNTFFLYQQTKLKYDEKEVFDFKYSLYQNTSNTHFYYYAAAAIILMLIIPAIFLFERKIEGTAKTVAERNAESNIQHSQQSIKIVPRKNKLNKQDKPSSKKPSFESKKALNKQETSKPIPSLENSEIDTEALAQVETMTNMPAAILETDGYLVSVPSPGSEENPLASRELKFPENKTKKYNSPKQWLLAEIKKQANKNIQTTDHGMNMTGSKIMPADLAGLLLGGINSITGSNMKLVYERGQRGQVTAMGISGKGVGVFLEK
ncbi:MAG: hypothetical protein ACK5CO_09725 [Bacteroidota bacterium]|jgi:hypothetical protein